MKSLGSINLFSVPLTRVQNNIVCANIYTKLPMINLLGANENLKTDNWKKFHFHNTIFTNSGNKNKKS